MGRLIIALFSLIFICHSVCAQELKVNGKFVQDSIKIGEDAAYYLTARYPSELNILFPDSTTSFSPFEFHKRQYFPTKTKGGISYDSVVYHLRTFETDSIQRFSLHVFVIHPADCTLVSAAPDSLILQAMIKNLPDSVSLQDLPLKETIAFEPIPTVFNYVILSFILGVLLVAAAAIWILFGKKIKRHYLIKKLQRNHNRFLEEFTTNLSKLQSRPALTVAESTATLWKKYLENLESKPYTKLTTKEIVRLVENEQVKDSLRSIDRAIYGNQAVNSQSFDGLKDFAEFEFRKKLEAVMHE